MKITQKLQALQHRLNRYITGKLKGSKSIIYGLMIQVMRLEKQIEIAHAHFTPATKKESFIEWVQGNEHHTSLWGKFYVKGIEGVKEDSDRNRRDRHHSYQCYYADTTNESQLFTIFLQDGDKYGTDTIDFYICKTLSADTEINQIVHNYTDCYCKGHFAVIAHGSGKTKAPRLMKWWIDNPDQSLEYAQLCAKAIQKRGCKDPLALIK